MVRHELGGLFGGWRCLLVDVFADKFQVYDAHSRFIDNMTLTSGFSKFGMPVDNLLSDTTTAVSSWCFYHVLNLFG